MKYVIPRKNDDTIIAIGVFNCIIVKFAPPEILLPQMEIAKAINSPKIVHITVDSCIVLVRNIESLPKQAKRIAGLEIVTRLKIVNNQLIISKFSHLNTTLYKKTVNIKVATLSFAFLGAWGKCH